MKNKIITISRQFGSGGRTIGRAVAAKLGIPCYDGELIAMIAERSGFSEAHLAELDEHSVKRQPFAGVAERATQSSILQTVLWNTQEKTILDLASKGPCVIIGRCANHILQNKFDCLNVYIHADKEFRANRIVTVYGETDDSPLKRIQEKDKRRKEYYQRYTNKKWGSAEDFHISLDSGSLGIDTCTELLVSLY